MAHHVVEIAQESRRPVHELFAALADHNNLRAVLLVPVRRVQDGEDDVNGVGSVRRLGVGPLALEETVTAFDRDRTLAYRISRGPGMVKNHRGTLSFERAGAGSRVTWTIEYDSLPVVGAALEAVLARVIKRGLVRLA